MLNRLIKIETRAGAPITAGDATLVPLAKSMKLMIPGVPAGLIWNRPAAVVVKMASGEEQVLTINDPTRRRLLALWGAVCGSALFTLVFILRRKNAIKKHKEMMK